ncbi:hypothetical protein CHUAL_013961 [Chamberlinius hualienensis]
MRDKPIDSIWMDGSLKVSIKKRGQSIIMAGGERPSHKRSWNPWLLEWWWWTRRKLILSLSVRGSVCCGCSACKVNDATITVLLKELILILYNPRIKMLQTKFTGEIS